MNPYSPMFHAIRPVADATVRCLLRSFGLIEHALVLIGVPEAMYQALRIGAIVFVPQLIALARHLWGLRVDRASPRRILLQRPARITTDIGLIAAATK